MNIKSSFCCRSFLPSKRIQFWGNALFFCFSYMEMEKKWFRSDPLQLLWKCIVACDWPHLLLSLAFQFFCSFKKSKVVYNGIIVPKSASANDIRMRGCRGATLSTQTAAHAYYFCECCHRTRVQNISAHASNIVACEEKTTLWARAAACDCFSLDLVLVCFLIFILFILVQCQRRQRYWTHWDQTEILFQ